jgi:hypothetical protein
MIDCCKSFMKRAISLLTAVLLLTLWCSPAAAQCAMCRASIGQNSIFARNLNIGVLVLLVPPVAMFCTIFILAIRHRRSG